MRALWFEDEKNWGVPQRRSRRWGNVPVQSGDRLRLGGVAGRRVFVGGRIYSLGMDGTPVAAKLHQPSSRTGKDRGLAGGDSGIPSSVLPALGAHHDPVLGLGGCLA